MNNADFISLFERSLRGLESTEMQEFGMVIQVSDAICLVQGLQSAFFGELVFFERGNQGIIFELTLDFVSVFLLNASITVAEEERVTRSGKIFTIPVGKGMLGRVLDVQGKALDMLGEIEYSENRPIETIIPSVVDREPIKESFETGSLIVDTLIPIGKGQRELIIGGRGTGKSTFIIDTILHQKNKNVICVYVAIGQRQAGIARFSQTLAEKGAMDYCVIVTAGPDESVLNRYIAPYVGCAIAEYFRDQGYDVLIVYDDLTSHAVAFREMSLLLRRSPGREAYPGDVFFLHSRLLERAGKLKSKGSITALPIVQIQGDDMTAYIPTNLISITDGQIFFDQSKFNRAIFPAINTELSVSRVGGAAQTRAIKRVTKALRLELAQYHDLLAFSQFGAELDESANRQLERGKRIVEILRQKKHSTLSFVSQALILFLLQESFLDSLPIDTIASFVTQFISYTESVYPDLFNEIKTSEDISLDVQDRLKSVALEFKILFAQSA